MKFFLWLYLILLQIVWLSACYDSDKTTGGIEENIAIKDKTISGVSQKGPFVNGSSVTMYELDSNSFGQTGRSFEGKIMNDQGEFSIQVKALESPYVLLKATGFYKNEVSGERSSSQVTLYAITDLSKRNSVNVNLLTHLEYERSMYLLMHDSLTLAAAKNRAKKEVLRAFYVDADNENSENLNIFESGAENAALLSISIMMQSNLKEAAFSERIANFASDLEDDGVWNDSSEIVKIADWSREQSLSDGLSKIQKNIESWNIGIVPDYEKGVKSLWWNVYGLGDCDDIRNDEVLRNQNEKSIYANEFYICKNNDWVLASDLEKDTYKWKLGVDGDSRVGSVDSENCYVYENSAWRLGNEKDCSLGLKGCTINRQDEVAQGIDKVWYTCDAKIWRTSSDYEKDTYGWDIALDGTIKNGNVTGTVYVFDKTYWRVSSSVESKLGVCLSAIKDSVGFVESSFYICRNNEWIEATTIEYDTYKWDAGENGESKIGSINTSICYVYENGAWRSGNSNDCSLGLNGCTANRQNEVAQGIDKAWYTCDEKKWRLSTNIEMDTVSWNPGFDGEIRVGKVNSTYYYIYEASSQVWREASITEEDTYDYENNEDWIAGVDGELRIGSVTKNIYVFDESEQNWRISTTEFDYTLGFNGCTVNRNKESVIDYDEQNEVNHYYVCYKKKWYDGNVWSWDLPKEVYFNPKIEYGLMTDSRDGQIYKTVQIGNQVWMAENLNYYDSNDVSLKNGSGCPKEDCSNFGRMYTWTAAMHTTLCDEGILCTVSTPHQGICPNGWHIPSREELKSLGEFDDLKSHVGWKKSSLNVEYKNSLGFNAIPVYGSGSYGEHGGTETYFRSIDDGTDGYNAYALFLYYTQSRLGTVSKCAPMAVRCVKNVD